MRSPIYPLQQILQVKEKRVSDAEKVVNQRKLELEKQETVLKEKQAARDKVKLHYDDKLKQLREIIETTSPKIQQMTSYTKVVKENLSSENKKVDDQMKIVKNAEQLLDTAKIDLKQRRIEVDKIDTHRKEWTSEERKKEEKKIEAEQEEIGSVIHQRNKKSAN